MQSELSLSEFFYNLIPGTLFLFILPQLVRVDFLQPLMLDSKSTLQQIFVFVILGVTVGFVFQMITKLIRNSFFNELIFLEVQRKNITNKYIEQAWNELSFPKKQVNKLDNEDRKSLFYAVDGYLRSSNQGSLSIHFSSRFAFWSNLFCGSSILFLLSVIFCDGTEICFIFLLSLVVLFSAKGSKEYMFALYDSSLKSFVTIKRDIKIL